MGVVAMSAEFLGSMAGSMAAAADGNGCLGRSCMKWGDDGELSPLDLQAILERLSAVDEQASGLMDCSLDPA